jgi:hypothetical protein
MCRDLRHQGRYLEALVKAEQASSVYAELVRQKVIRDDHPLVLAHYRDLSIIQRLAGHTDQLLAGAQDAYDRYRRSPLEIEHPDTLAAGINLGNTLRLAGSLKLPGGDLEGGVARLEQTVTRYGARWSPDHPFVHAATINLAVAQFAVKDFERAHALLVVAREGLQRKVGNEHHWTLVCETNLATALAELERPEEARQLGEAVWPVLQERLSETHPHTLACAGNLALDRATTGEPDTELSSFALIQSERGLGVTHYDVATMRGGGRISTVIEPPPV